MAETPFSSTSTIFQAMPLISSRVSVATNEIVRRLKYHLPLAIDEANTRIGHPTGKGIRKPESHSYYPAPAVLTDKYINSVLVSVALSFVAHSPGRFRTEGQVVIYVIDERIEHANQVSDAWDRGQLAMGCLMPYLTNCEDADGHQCWRLLEPQSMTALPEAYDEFSGVSCNYRIVQDPSVDNWI